ncbi:acyltransferase family-domain-containing protein [Massariosphaeria phaeospora]|uniref:Acyltransferase family-domain-containing protein n=1 Tax=Massariosphaeria phaeospora TaxID=100035 RepID=A0A7C8IHI2_9PLEO|nr:acyltransferase family-domain-containing protein [Massariosphaeria phaeospora]
MAPRDANWIDGLRGIASFMVVSGHLCTALVPWLHAPAHDPKTAPHLFQLPFLRLAVGGRSAVALFFLITGYVNSIGPIGRSRAGNTDAALNGIARSALARSGRLVLPTMIATALSWFLANTNAYHMTKHVDSTWIRQGWHRQEPTLWQAFKSLTRAEVETWTIGWNDYDGTQWTLHLFLEGSMLVYMTMFATVLVKPKARFIIYAVLYIYFWQLGEGLAIGALKGLNIIFGMFVAELHNHYKDSATSVLPAPVPALMIILGAFMAGYPQDAPHNARWSHLMQTFMHSITVKDSDVRRYWDHIGAATVLLGIFFSRNARRVLTSPVFNFLGRVSFPVYLMHNTMIKSVLTWMVYLPSAMNPPRNEKGEQMDLQRGTTMHIFIAIGIFFYILYRTAALWVQHIDPLCGNVVNAFTKWAYGETAATHKGPTTRNGHVEKTVLPA